MANVGAYFNHCLVHFGFYLFFENNFAAFDNFVHVGTQFPRNRINDLEFFFDAEGEEVGGSGFFLCSHKYNYQRIRINANLRMVKRV